MSIDPVTSISTTVDGTAMTLAVGDVLRQDLSRYGTHLDETTGPGVLEFETVLNGLVDVTPTGASGVGVVQGWGVGLSPLTRICIAHPHQ